MDFIRKFRKAWREASRSLLYSEDADQPGYWTEADARGLSTYFASDSGRKLRLILQNWVFRSAVQATQQVGNLEYHCAKAQAIAEVAALLTAHFSRVPAQWDESEVTAPDMAEFLASLNV